MRQIQALRGPLQVGQVSMSSPAAPRASSPRCGRKREGATQFPGLFERTRTILKEPETRRLKNRGHLAIAVGTPITGRPPQSGRIEARTGLRMMPTSPRSPLSFRTAGFPQYGWEGGILGGAFPTRAAA